MTIQTLLEQYHSGKITDNHFVVESLFLIDPDDPGVLLSHLPDVLLQRVLAFTKAFQPGRMLTNFGALPAQDQIVGAGRWIEELLRHQSSKSA